MITNNIVELVIEDMSVEGQGIGRIRSSGDGQANGSDGLVVFVEGAVKGDRVRAEITKVRKRFAFAKATETLEESPLRSERFDCSFRTRGCGGCPLGELKYEAQLRIKEQQIRDRLERIAGIELAGGNGSGGLEQDGRAGGNGLNGTDASGKTGVLRPIIGMEEDDGDQGPLRYRNKAVMKISTGGLMTRKGGVQEPVHEPRIGFYQTGTHETVDCSDCCLQIGTAMAAAEATRRFMAEDHICSYDDRWDKGLMKQMTVRTAFGTGEVMVIYDIDGKGIPNADKLVEYLDDAVYEAGGSLESVVIRNDKKTETIAGKNTITDTVVVDDEDPIELGFEISANSFYQVNHDQMERLYSVVRRYCRKVWKDEEDAPVVLDLYCGIGTIGLCVADIAEEVIGIEAVKDAVTDANRNAVINGIVNARFICGKAEETMAQIQKADIAILDPPRAGCRNELLDAIAFAEIPNIVYVSCDPATLARDIRALAGHGYEVIEATPVDMFPHTSHVETVVLLSDKKIDGHINIDLDVKKLEDKSVASK